MTHNGLIQQFKRESQSWKRLLDFLQTENIYCKTSIAEMGNFVMSKELLAAAENFQNLFMSKDEIIALTKKDVIAFQNLLINKINSENEDIRDILHIHKKLQREIEIIEQKCNQLRTDFNHYLAETL
jgi:hypothetical protein